MSGNEVLEEVGQSVRKQSAQKKEGIDLCLEDILIKGLRINKKLQ